MTSSVDNGKKRTNDAIRYLKSIKPNDGWTADRFVIRGGKEYVHLKRRNISLTKETVGFEELARDEATGHIVGVTSYMGVGRDASTAQYARGVVLVRSDGTIERTKKDIRITLPRPDKRPQTTPTRTTAVSSSSSSSSISSSGGGNNSEGALSDEQNKVLLTCGLVVLGVLIVGKILSSAFSILYILGIPVLVLYAKSTLPPSESFDGKKEVKKVLKGEHLPEGHKDKPRGWLSETVAQVAATVTTEMATALEGYQVELVTFMNVATLASVAVPASKMEFYWIGAFGKWWFVMGRQMPSKKDD